ncbi:MAG: LPS export ABC transporter periplasmic protein LptC [Burkholderiaceae bacterium]
MNARLFDRVAAGISMLILVVLGLVSYLLALQAQRMLRPTADPTPRHEPDYFVEGVKVLKVNEAGEPSLRIEATRLRHYPDNDTLEFDNPRVLTLTADRPALEVVAETGVGPGSGTRAELSGNVVVEREATPQSARLIARTDQATVLFDEKIIETDRPVEIELGPNRLNGTGMRLDGQSRQLRVDSRVRGTLAPETGASRK